MRLPAVGSRGKGYTLANTAYDFGGDPHAQAFAAAYETPDDAFYHEHIYHTGPEAATLGIAKALARYSEPVIAAVNHGEHSVIVAGVWATGNPLIDDNVQIRALAVYNPWDQKTGEHISARAIMHASPTKTGSMPPISPVPGRVSLPGLASPTRAMVISILIHQYRGIRQDLGR